MLRILLISGRIFVFLALSRSGLTNLWHTEKFPLHAVDLFTAASVCFFFFARPASLYCEECMCICVCVHMYIYIHTPTHTYVTTRSLYHWHLIILQWNILAQIGSCAKCWLDIYHRGVDLAVTGRTRDVGQKVLHSSFQTGSSSSSSYFQIFFRIGFLEEVFIISHYALIIQSIIIIIMEGSNGHADGFLRNLLTIWARALESVRQPWTGLTAGITDLP
jgi:hypothetical protein